MAHCQRWEDLDVLMPFEHMHLLHGDMPLLRTLAFSPSNFPHGRRSRFAQTPFHAAPQLKRIILTRNFFTSVTALPWAQLTHLEADCLYEHECLEIFRDAPLLVAGTFRLCHPPGAEPILPPNPWPSTLPAHTCLRDLVLDADGEFLGVGTTILPRLSAVLDRLTLPALCTLLVAEPCITLESLAAFIARSGCYMENLCIAGASLPASAYRAALPPFDNLGWNREHDTWCTKPGWPVAFHNVMTEPHLTSLRRHCTGGVCYRGCGWDVVVGSKAFGEFGYFQSISSGFIVKTYAARRQFERRLT
jgi:hypothetical protein